MRFYRLFSVALLASFIFGSSFQIALAQDSDMEKITCDSTLATLLLVAEHDYDYLSAKMDMDMMDDPALHIDLGVLDPVVQEITAMMMDMMDEGDSTGDMSDEDMAMHDEMLANMMNMSAAEAVAAYLSNMNMDVMDMNELPAGDVSGEDPTCAAVRADVQQFLIAHILTEMSMMDM